MVLIIVCVVVCAVLLSLIAVAAWRFCAVRSRGVAVCMREIGTRRLHHWHHGVMVFGEDSAEFYRLRSLKPAADIVMDRHITTITDRRQLTSTERARLGETHVMVLNAGGHLYEVAVDHGLDTALVSWIESSPSVRAQRLTSPNWPVHSHGSGVSFPAFRRRG